MGAALPTTINKLPLATSLRKMGNHNRPNTIHSLPVFPKSQAHLRAITGNQMPMPRSATHLSARDALDYSSDAIIADIVEMCFAGSILCGRYPSTRMGIITQMEDSIEDVDIVGGCTRSGKKTNLKLLRGEKVWRPVPLRKLWAQGVARARMIRRAAWRQALRGSGTGAPFERSRSPQVYPHLIRPARNSFIVCLNGRP